VLCPYCLIDSFLLVTQPIERLGQNQDGTHPSLRAIALRKNPEEEGVFNSKLLSILCRLPHEIICNTLSYS
jgi:hypothetical protein